MATVLITGANRGIGLELVKRYAARGDSVLACCRNPAGADALNAIEGEVSVQGLEVTEAASVGALVAALDGRTVDTLINNAGVLGPDNDKQSATDMDFEGWAETLAVNTIAPVRVMQALLPNLKRSSDPKIVTITSQMGALALDITMSYAYCSSKAALNKFMKLAAVDLGKSGLNVCVIHPGWVQTDMGGPNAAITADESASGIVATIDKLNADTNGSFWKWNGESHEW